MDHMSEPVTLPRPRQVTMAAWMIMGGSVLVVASVFERVSGLNGLETQEAIERFLAAPPGTGLDLDVEGALAIIRAVSMVAAGCAAAAAILGFHLLKRSRGARLGITLLAAPLFVSGLVAGGFLSSLVAASAVMLWLEPSRDWFNGKPAKPPPEPERRTPERSAPTAPPPASSGARPHQGFGSVPPGPSAFPGASHAAQSALQTHQSLHGPSLTPPPAPPPRPDSVLWACIVTWVFSGLAGLTMAALALVIVASPETFFDELRQRDPTFDTQGFSDGSLANLIYVTAAVTVVWSSVATVLAILLFNRVSWARIALVACASGAGAVCLVTAVGSLVMVAPLLGCGVTIALLLRREVRAWTAAP